MKVDQLKNHLIVALDVPSGHEALGLVEKLKSIVGYFKIGLQLYTSQGPEIIQKVKKSGCGVFLDLKLHDIPNTVANAVTEAAALGIDMLTLHTLGGEKMMTRAGEIVMELSAKGKPAPSLLGVTVLTSMDSEELSKVGFKHSIPDLVLRLARLAQRSGLDGLVCSPQELTRLNKEGITELFFVTPGIRPSDTSADDQKRIMTPKEAVLLGARHLVIGRPIIKANDPAEAAERILFEIEQGLKARKSV